MDCSTAESKRWDISKQGNNRAIVGSSLCAAAERQINVLAITSNPDKIVSSTFLPGLNIIFFVCHITIQLSLF
jgi:hypothetical protein